MEKLSGAVIGISPVDTLRKDYAQSTDIDIMFSVNNGEEW